MIDPNNKQKGVCWECQEYTFIYQYGINGLCLRCLQKIENDELYEDDKEKLWIGRYARSWIDCLSKNDRTNRNYNPELNEIVATENKSLYDCIDKCKKRIGS